VVLYGLCMYVFWLPDGDTLCMMNASVMCMSSANLEVVHQLSDHVAEGRACGNLGNTHYLLGNFSLAVSFHQEVTTSTAAYKS